MINFTAVRLACELMGERKYMYRSEIKGLIQCLRRYYVLKELSEEDITESANKAVEIVFGGENGRTEEEIEG